MAVSATVNEYMQQQGTAAPPQSAESLFLKQFMQLAYDTLQAKFPALLSRVVTFRVPALDLDEGSAFGVFLLRRGADLVYVPAVMSQGSMVSCEMGYDRRTDQFFPLDDASVQGIVDADSYSQPTLLTDNPRVEDTRTWFHNMLRPPQSSNVVLAGERGGIADLPDRCKEALSDYLRKENPQLLAKMASFYDVELLASRLARRPEEKAASEAVVSLPSFLRLDTLTKEAAAALAEQERREILEHGWLVKTSTTDGELHVAPEENIAKAVEQELHLEEYTGKGLPLPDLVGEKKVDHVLAESAHLVSAEASGLAFHPALLCGSVILTKNGTFRLPPNTARLIADRGAEKDVSSFVKREFPDKVFPITKIEDHLSKVRPYHSWVGLVLLIPARNGRLLALDAREFLGGGANVWTVRKLDSDTFISVYERTLHVSPEINLGYISSFSDLVVPRETMGFLCSGGYREEPLQGISSFDVLRKIMTSLGRRLTTVDNGAGISITDMSTEKTASFATTADAAAWLHDTFGMTGPQARTVLENRSSLVFSKRAFMEPDDAAATAMRPQSGVPQEMQAQGEVPVQGMPQPDAFDPSMLGDFAAVEDEDVMDAGIMAAFAQDPDIKSLLVEYLPDFLEAQDRVGRILLLFSYRKKEIEDFYGSEKYSGVLQSCRKIFSILGKLSASLKLYVNMA